MKSLKNILIFSILFMFCLLKVDAKPFKIGENEYDTLVAAVAAVPTDGTKTTIEMTEDVDDAPGVIVASGKNIVIDFGGHTYETSEPMVGSLGTETLSFQLLKNSTVYMKNGTLIASNHETSKMFIQNYADLTLEDITIDATTNTYDYFYGVSSNNGKVNIIGNTSIKVNTNTHARAFDMCWAPNKTYVDGTQMIIDTTGTINGIIELDVWGGRGAEPILSTLTIKNINFTGTWEIDEYLAGQLSIEGGKFAKTNTINLDEFVTGNNISYTTDDETYEVLPSGRFIVKDEKIYVQKGSEYKLNFEITEGYDKYIKYSTEDNKVATIKNGVVTGVGVVSTVLNYSFGRTGGAVEVVVYELNTELSSDAEEDDTSSELNELAEQIISNVLNDKDQDGVDSETISKLKQAIQEGKSIKTDIGIKELKKENLDTKVVEKIEAVAQKVSGEIKGFLDIDVLLKADNTELGKITKLPNGIKLTVDVDKEFGEIPANTNRTFFVVRMHEGEEPELLEATYKDGKLTFETDRFSQYAYGYTDKDVDSGTNPKTGDGIMIYIVLLLISIVGATLFIKKNKNRIINIKN